MRLLKADNFAPLAYYVAVGCLLAFLSKVDNFLENIQAIAIRARWAGVARLRTG